MGIKWTNCVMILSVLFSIPATPECLEILKLESNSAIVVRCLPVEFECRVSSSEAVIWWTFNGRNVSGNGRVEREEERSVLRIGCPLPNSNSGQYTCHAVMEDDPDTYTNRSLAVNVHATSINVQSRPFIVAKLGEPVKLKCTAVADINWDIIVMVDYPRWSRNGREVGDHLVTRKVDGKRHELVLTIVRFYSGDAGLYTCIAGYTLNPVITNTHLISSFSLAPPSVTVRMLNQSNTLSGIVHWPPLQLDTVRVQYYSLNISCNDQVKIHPVVVENASDRTMMYLWQPPLENTFYTFTVSACVSDDVCGDPSQPSVLAYFKDFEKPERVVVECRYDNISLESFLNVIWEPPDTSIALPLNLAYQVEVYGRSLFRTSEGDMRFDAENQTYTSSQLGWRQRMKSNTNYTVQVCVQTAFGCGTQSDQSVTTSCSTPPSVPAEIPALELHNVAEQDCDCLELDVLRVSERYGSIRCYRIILYKLKEGQTEVPDSVTVPLTNYHAVHTEHGYGAYVAESFRSENFKTKVVLGDEIQSQCAFEQEINSSLLRRRRSDLNESPDRGADHLISEIYDGKLDPGAVYSGFIEIVVDGVSGRELRRRSSMFPSVKIVNRGSESAALPTALGVICGLVAIILILIVALCLLRRKNMERLPRDDPILPQPSMKPIRKDQLVTAYLERHKDSDLIFQREYELLPEYFKDRSSKSSDSPDNIFKNRYPDIKAYDQTRVKLKQVTGTPGADYINANFVPGYKNRKKYICAQGPLEKTINEFWRMIWEQRVEVIAMVTGLEENGKSKCAKYWPDAIDTREQTYGDIVVSLTEDRPYGDYSVRRFRVKVAQSLDTSESDTLTVTQLHFTAWRDFLAPDRPGGILKFMKRLQEIWKPPISSHLLVHCSAGVGRSGTLIAIDILMEQLEDEGEINVYQTVAELRRHRNFMVQSLTQYIFIYRAVMEFHQFGYTEVKLSQLSAQLEYLESGGEGNKTMLETEFHKLDELVEDHKSTDVGSIEPNAKKNRCDYILPFDKNRVVLTSIPNEDSSTYINASAILGCDRSTAYILTQDPLEVTIGDFWRMICEQRVAVIVMLSQSVGNSNKDQCPVYWPESEEPMVFKHISVQVEDEDENDELVKRKFTVTNALNSKEVTVIQLQLKNWNSSLPESPDQLLRLVENVSKVVEDGGRKDPVVVHCSNGGERSSLFTALSILVGQAKREKRVDVFHTVCNLRSERQLMIPTLDHYHFCYKAILEYAKSDHTYE